MSESLQRIAAELVDAASRAIELAAASGLEASASANSSRMGQVVVRDGEVEAATRETQRGLGVTVYSEGRRGSASTNALDPASVLRAVEEAICISRQVDADQEAGLADPAWLAREGEQPVLFSPNEGDTQELLDMALAIDREGRAIEALPGVTVRIDNSGAVASEGTSALATTAGFCRSVVWSRHARWCAALARSESGVVQDFADAHDRRIDALPSAAEISARAVDIIRETEDRS